MVLIPDSLMPHGGLVSYEAYAGQSGNGVVFDEPVIPARAKIEEKRTLVRDSNGREVVSEVRVWLDPEHIMKPGSKLTVWRGQPNEVTMSVIRVAYHTHSNLLPSHIELSA